VVLLSPRGRRFDQETARRLAGLERLVLLCGRYEGIDERVAETLATEELSLGDFVLTGGETAALAVIEATVRLVPGALGDSDSAADDSFEAACSTGRTTRGRPSGAAPRCPRCCSRETTRASGAGAGARRCAPRAERRPELLARARLTAEDEALLRDIEDGPGGRARVAGQNTRRHSQIGTEKRP
jgi:tRNA (guanine37-N1)-methyltransferase